MTERAEDLRREAARCLKLARLARDPGKHDDLIQMAARFHELAKSVDGSADFGATMKSDQDGPATPPKPPKKS